VKKLHRQLIAANFALLTALKMFYLVTILSFVVVIPFAIGMRYFNRMPQAMSVIVLLCGAWSITEILMFSLRVQGINNAFLSYALTAVEVYLFSGFYFHTTGNRYIRMIAFSSIPLVVFDYLVFGTPLNTFSLVVEYILITGMAVYLFIQITRRKASADFFLINLTLLFYFLSSFPYFLAWEWLRTTNMDLLGLLAGIHLYVHAICYLIIAFTLWKSQLSYSAR